MRPQPAGLTLVELLVVLSVIAVLSTVALRSLVGNLEEANYDANLLQLQQLELAVIGENRQDGFVRDIGRLPQAIGDAEYDPDTRSGNLLIQLGELWDQGILPVYAINQAVGLDSEVSLGTGWRGPYLSLGVDRDDLTDSFANPFVAYQADGTLSDDTDPIAIIQSFGSNGFSQFGTTGDVEVFPEPSDASYERDLEIVFESDANAVAANLAGTVTNRWQTLIDPVEVERADGANLNTADGRFLVLRVYGPQNGLLVTLFQGVIDLEALDTNNDSVVDAADTPAQTPQLLFNPPALANGPKVFRVYQIDGAVAAPADQAEIIGDGAAPEPAFTVELRSSPNYVVVGRSLEPLTLRLF